MRNLSGLYYLAVVILILIGMLLIYTAVPPTCYGQHDGLLCTDDLYYDYLYCCQGGLYYEI